MPVKLPKGYEWLYKEPGPLMLKKAIELYGTVEFAGAPDNPIILDWAEEIGVRKVYSDDAIPWCGLFIGVCAKRGTWDQPKNGPLWARNWLGWGQAVNVPMLGDVMVYSRGSGGHVAMYVGEDKVYWHIIGGNQSDAVTIMKKQKRTKGEGALLGARRAPWRIAQPSNVRQVFLKSTGVPTSGSEA